MKSNAVNVFKIVVHTPYLLALLLAASAMSCFVVVTACAHAVKSEGQFKLESESTQQPKP